MNPERWKQIEEIYHAAVERNVNDRADFLTEACGDDVSLRSQVEALLILEMQTTNFIESPALEIAAKALAKEQPKTIIGRKINNYKVERLLGAGGMGEVYLAEDTQLGRKVALKILAPHLVADEQSRARFLREARLASLLDHPNICTIHEIGESDGQCFISMQYVEGKTLSDVIGGRALDLKSLLSIGLQIADALRTAHTQGIIHRDIKSANILINNRGQAKVLDFGLAKLLSTESGEKLTQTGAICGTPAYMSPEQARGEQVDHRSDIFSFGVVLYEMATGQLPFRKKSKAETMNAIINEPHKSIGDKELPQGLSEATDRALAKNPDERYQTMEEMLSDLRQVAIETDSLRSLDVPGGVIIPFVSPQRRGFLNLPKWILPLAAVLILAVLVGVWAYFFRENKTAIDSLAVMPFANESGNVEVEYLSDGMTETLISSLSQLPNLSVKARSSVFHYKGKGVSPQQVGADLNVQAVLNGRIIQRGDGLTLYLSLVDARTGNQIWGEQYNRKSADLVSLQSEIARDVSNKLKTKLSGADEQKLAKNYTANPEAYKLYLRGRFHSNKRTPRDLQKAVEYFQQAVALDPNYALAYAGLADAYTLSAAFGSVLPREGMPKAKDAALRAISLDDRLAEPHTALGHTAEYFDYDLTQAEHHFKRAIELNPNYSTAHEYYGTLLSNLGRHEEAETEFRRALELEPLSLGTNRMYGEMLFFARRYDEAIAQLKKTIELDDSFASAHRSLGRVYLVTKNHAGHVEEWARHYEIIGEPQIAALMRESFAKGGWKGYLQAMTGEKRPTKYFFPFYVAIYYAELGDKGKAFAELDKTFEERLYYIAWLKTDPCLDPLRDDPRFQDLLRRAGFPP
jgi:serine/threonine-protein kinase